MEAAHLFRFVLCCLVVYRRHDISLRGMMPTFPLKGSSVGYPVQMSLTTMSLAKLSPGHSLSLLIDNRHGNSLSPERYGDVFNSLAPGKFEWSFWCNFQIDFSDGWLRHLLWNCPNMTVTGCHWWSVNIGTGSGLVPSGNKPLPEPMLTQIFVCISHC